MISRHSPVQVLLDANAAWAAAQRRAEPDFFAKSALGQHPKVLWIGCADSRVPESLLTGARPGDIFVHRNIANQFHPSDDSALAVLSYAVGIVGVEYIVLAGHTHCGGAAACYETVRSNSDDKTANKDTPLSRWLKPLTSLVATLDLSNMDTTSALDTIVHENVKHQVANICESEPVRLAWAAGKSLWVHGWVYDVASGAIKDVGVTRGPDNAATED